MSTLYGYAGKLLRVDLSNEKITDENLDEETARKYVGGTGLGAKYLYEEVPAGVEWSDEDNRMIMATGPVGGTRMGGSGTFSVVTKGPLTNGAVATQANGFFGTFLKFSGFDGIILKGKAKKWTYLYIHDGKAELRDASHLVGKDTWETTDIIKSELGKGEHGMSVAAIGQAGENLVKFAGIMVDKGHIASHGGAGAVMGSKKLKAIAVDRGTLALPLKDKDGISAIAEREMNNILNNPMAKNGAYSWGTMNGVIGGVKGHTGIVPVKNYTTAVWNIEPDKLEKFNGAYIREHFEPKAKSCWACSFHHCHELTLTEGPFKGYIAEEPEYEILASFGPVIDVTDVEATIFLGTEADRLGMDGNETGWTISLLMECYEKGILNRKDCDGLEMTWGNYEAANQMMHKIAMRQGFGNILADGVMKSAQRIGGEALNLAIYTLKGNTPRTHDHRNRWPTLFDTCLSQMSTDEGYTVGHPEDLGLSIKPNLAPNFTVEDTIAWNAQAKGAIQFEDCVGTCRLRTNTDIRLLAELVTAATGWDFSPKEGMEVGRRIVNLLRAFNIRHGHTVEMDAPSPRYGSTPVDGPSQGKSIMANWDDMRRKYYEQMGWDGETGKPLPDTLRHFGLETAIPELWEK
jgi:aldehyde:ferredoxin oxidoreductase